MNINYILNRSTSSSTSTILKYIIEDESNNGPSSIEPMLTPTSYDINKKNQYHQQQQPQSSFTCDGPDPINFILNESKLDTIERQKSFLKKTKIYNNEMIDQYFNHYYDFSFGEKIFALSNYSLYQQQQQHHHHHQQQLSNNKNNNKINDMTDIIEITKYLTSYNSFIYYRLFDLKESAIDLGFINYNRFTVFKEVIDILETLSIVTHYKGTNIYKWNGGYHVNQILNNLLEKRIIFEPNEKSKDINYILVSFLKNKKIIKNFNSIREKNVWDVLVGLNIIKIINNGSEYIINDENSLF